MKTVDIFIKSYKPDFWLLQLALKTIAKNVTGYNNIILLIPERDKHDFDTRELPPRTLVHYVEENFPGWLWQQVCKVKAHYYSFADYIMFSDSDAFVDHPINVQDVIKSDKPEILFTPYTQLPDAVIWQAPTSKLIGENVEFEYMRRLGLTYHRSTLLHVEKWQPDLEKIIMHSARFSEFNLIGAYANKFEHEKYSWVNTDDWEYVPPLFNQVWSHASKADGADELHLREYIRVLETIMKSFDIPVPQ